MFLIPSFVQHGASLPKALATLTTFTERQVAYEMEWKLAIQHGGVCSGLLPQDLS